MKKKKLNKAKVIIVLGLLTSITLNFVLYGLGQTLQKENNKLGYRKTQLQEELKICNEKYDALLEECKSSNWKSLGTFKITCYWKGEDKWGPVTKSGNKAKINHTIAVDPTVIPLGTKVKIDNQIYVAEDIGGAVKGNVVDVWVETENKNFGRKYKEVFIYEWTSTRINWCIKCY